MPTDHIHELVASSFEAGVLRSPLPYLVEFSADWCPPCRMIEPVVAELATALVDRLSVGRLDADRSPELSARYGVLSLPTLMVFVGGQPRGRLVGFVSPGHVRRWVGEALETALAG